jgi:hypothetical protein
VRHITPAGLDALEPLLEQLRAIDGLGETRRDAFSVRSRAFLHFHEDPEGYFADVRFTDTVERCRVTTRAEQRTLVTRIRKTV